MMQSKLGVGVGDEMKNDCHMPERGMLKEKPIQRV